MNLKYILKNSDDKLCYCIICKDYTLQEEFEKVFGITKGYGYSVDCFKEEIKIMDYFHGDTRAKFKIIDILETEEEVVYQIKEIEL